MKQLDAPILEGHRAHDAQALLQAVRTIAQGELSRTVQDIDQKGHYPESVLRQLAAAGAMSAHLKAPHGLNDFGLAIRSIAEVAKVCGSTGFMMWCQAVCGLYLQEASAHALQGPPLSQHVSGQRLGGTALSNPMKTYAKIESFMLKAVPVEGGYRVSGSLPWVSNLGPDHYCGAIATIQDGGAERELMFLLRCDADGITLKECPSFSGMEGTATYGLHLNEYFVPRDEVIADPAKPLIKKIRAAFVMLQCGMAAGVIQGAIDSMWAVEAQLGHVNRYLEDRPDTLQRELDALLSRIMTLAQTPYDDRDAFFIQVLDARAHGAELSLRAAQSALLHQGARGYLMSSEVQRRVRESHFVAIVTPAIKHLRSEMARLSQETMPA
ncbi:acyl-CoA dehydrogenase family protein [Zwartia sp.]|uniref:acyl-CoA dehydrogenase family protein n=1 Tax=Zwartia sp. TaxID=2978004 RepID=UPI0027251D38|nr:acyl-CoA dehydrogenase family protein [Zwartia sp.]MDO9023629.1 acyl-CoA dehydrogenase family protein [Zwartia sp.]